METVKKEKIKTMKLSLEMLIELNVGTAALLTDKEMYHFVAAMDSSNSTHSR